MGILLGRGPGNPCLREFGRCTRRPWRQGLESQCRDFRSFFRVTETGGQGPFSGNLVPWRGPVLCGIGLDPLVLLPSQPLPCSLPVTDWTGPAHGYLQDTQLTWHSEHMVLKKKNTKRDGIHLSFALRVRRRPGVARGHEDDV